MDYETKQQIAKTLGAILGTLSVVILFGLLVATFVTFIISFFANYPVTIGNVLLTWGVIIAIRLVLLPFRNAKK